MVKAKLLEWICVSILCGIFLAGLWPFHAPANRVSWLDHQNGIGLVDHGTLLSNGMLQMTGSTEPACSIEIWLEPRDFAQGNSFLAFYTPDHPRLFSFHQELSDLVLRAEVQNQHHEFQAAAFNIPDIFLQKRWYLITIVSGPRKTAVYLDGRFVRASQRFLVPNNCKGKLIVGNSPVDNTGWSGQVRGLAIYDQELTAGQIGEHYSTWVRKGRPDIAQEEQNVVLYLFDEQRGTAVHNRSLAPDITRAAAAHDLDLCIPKNYTVVAPQFLEAPWNEFRLSWSYLEDILINIAGFVPLGLFFRAYLSTRQVRRGMIATVAFGVMLSLTIEVLQSFLPTRSSSSTDVITNSIGTCIGAFLYCFGPSRTLVGKALKSNL